MRIASSPSLSNGFNYQRRFRMMAGRWREAGTSGGAPGAACHPGGEGAGTARDTRRSPARAPGDIRSNRAMIRPPLHARLAPSQQHRDGGQVSGTLSNYLGHPLSPTDCRRRILAQFGDREAAILRLFRDAVYTDEDSDPAVVAPRRHRV